eukprot:CAMPEP_0113552870 /NCGR_PEP_ID=MMETSP0015_2-20120614/15303_1 /TAXON_ID=2838 /ORGANISM="Odontella" /LENGTH=571 /DNA_ID=CAMNT_0000453887 /DNA_START=34 /DNA_END=1746 /DNA_ORIENTATION=- /assembly_acc=CAM_ASM_000160
MAVATSPTSGATATTPSTKSMSTLKVKPKIKRSRDPLSPKPILDRRLLSAALDDAGVSLKPGQIDDFYQLLHRQHYPSVAEFVETYRLNDAAKKGLLPDGDERSVSSTSRSGSRPLKNLASNRPGKRNIRNLPKAFLKFLEDPSLEFVTVTSSVKEARTSADGSTTKLAVELQDGHVVEAVIMRHVSPAGSRATLCVSSQVGCAMGCTFCATGTMGIRGNLSSGEILEQLVHAGRILADDVANDDGEAENSKQRARMKHNHDLVRNVVFMGMGEPLNNYVNVIDACRGLIDCRRWNLAHGRVTVSTVGVIPKMRALTRDLPEVSLALSLHAPNQEARTAIVPTAKQYPIEKLIDALDEHMMAVTKRKMGDNGDDAGGFSADQRKMASKQKRAMIEYVMLEGDTSSLECAHQLGKLCEDRSLLVNLIPYNQTDVKDKLRCPSFEHMREFQRIVMTYGTLCVIRRTMGADIAGACGQLVVEGEKKEESDRSGTEGKETVTDIEEGPFRRTGSSVSSASATSAAAVTRHRSRNMSARGGGEVAPDGGEGDSNGESDLEGWVRPLAIATAVAASC